MDCIFNKEKLKKVLYDFYESTGVAITLYDAEKKIVATSPVYTGLCSLLRSKKCCKENCDKSDLWHMKEVSADQKICRYTCHAGLMETIIPVVYENILIAYMQIGQFRDESRLYSSEEMIISTAKKYGFDEAALLSFYSEIPIISEKKFSSLCNIMEIIIKSFWTEGLIKYNKSMLSVRIESYIDEHLSENIHISDLCDKFFISKNSLYELFRSEFNTTVGELITQKRLALAKELLASSSDMNVMRIASACGFSDYNYFIRLYKKRTGKTPLQFRKSKQI